MNLTFALGLQTILKTKAKDPGAGNQKKSRYIIHALETKTLRKGQMDWIFKSEMHFVITQNRIPHDKLFTCSLRNASGSIWPKLTTPATTPLSFSTQLVFWAEELSSCHVVKRKHNCLQRTQIRMAHVDAFWSGHHTSQSTYQTVTVTTGDIN